MSLTPTQLGLLAHLSAVTLLFSALLIPPSKLTYSQLALAFLPPIWACHIYSWSVGLGFLAAVQALWATELLLFQNPREKFLVIYHQPSPFWPSPKVKVDKSESDSSGNAQSKKDDKTGQIWKQHYPSTFWNRCSWVFKLHVSMRYVGWDIGSRTPSPHMKRQSRTSWLWRNTLLAGLCFLAIDGTTAYQHLDPYFQIETPIDSSFPPRLATLLSRYGLGLLPPRLGRIVVLGVQQYAVFTLINRISAIIHVSLGGLGILDEWWGGAESWPMLMGSPLVVWNSGLRGFWGRGWHQFFRSLLTSPGKAIVKMIGVTAESTTAYAIRIAVAFFLSGVLHAATLPFNVLGLSPLNYASFFWIQGVCVLIEVMAEKMLGEENLKLSGKGMRRGVCAVRVVWTVSVLLVTAPLIVDELTRVTRIMGLRPTVVFPLLKLRFECKGVERFAAIKLNLSVKNIVAFNQKESTTSDPPTEERSSWISPQQEQISRWILDQPVGNDNLGSGTHSMTQLQDINGRDDPSTATARPIFGTFPAASIIIQLIDAIQRLNDFIDSIVGTPMELRRLRDRSMCKQYNSRGKIHVSSKYSGSSVDCPSSSHFKFPATPRVPDYEMALVTCGICLMIQPSSLILLNRIDKFQCWSRSPTGFKLRAWSLLGSHSLGLYHVMLQLPRIPTNDSLPIHYVLQASAGNR